MNTRLQRGVIIVPSALTIGNLFFGMWAIVAAARGHFALAAWLVVIAAFADMVDGRVARVTQTGSRFGAELDSLVDAISFGVAPAIIIYHLVLSVGEWSWVASFFYVTCAVVRLARFNIEQGGEAKVNFHGLPSPTAGATLATYYPFSQTDFFREHLSTLPWTTLITTLMIIIGGLMVSHVLYPVVPKFGFRTVKGLASLAMLIITLVAAFTIPALFFFPATILYITYGLVKALVMGFFERLPDRDLMLDIEEGDEADAEMREMDYYEFMPPQRVWRPRGKRPRRAEDRDEDEE